MLKFCMYIGKVYYLLEFIYKGKGLYVELFKKY